jgi:hypothetical protein
MIHISPESGRNDHIHGDEQYNDHVEAIDVYDVIYAIEAGTSTEDGVSHHEWITRICAGDEITKIIGLILSKRDDYAYAEIMNEIEAAIEGWL